MSKFDAHFSPIGRVDHFSEHQFDGRYGSYSEQCHTCHCWRPEAALIRCEPIRQIDSQIYLYNIKVCLAIMAAILFAIILLG